MYNCQDCWDMTLNECYYCRWMNLHLPEAASNLTRLCQYCVTSLWCCPHVATKNKINGWRLNSLHFILFFQLWILPAFGCRPQYDNGLEQETFGFGIWTTVLNFAIPLNLFYRMHSVASLFEVFRRVWQNSWWLSMTENMHWDTCHNGLPTVSHSAGQPFRRQSGSHSSRLESKLQRQTKCWCLSEGITERWTYVPALLEDLSRITWCLFKMVMKKSFVFFFVL